MPAWVNAGFDEYAKRMPREMPLQLKEIKAAPRTNAVGDAPRWMQAEAERIRAAMPPGAVRVVLDEHGRSFPTRTLADHLRRWRDDSCDVAFVIGGADGLAAEVKEGAALLWSLSPLTLPHGMVRVVVAEQLYRASSILANHPYHRE